MLLNLGSTLNVSRGKGANSGKCWKKCQNYRFLDIFLDILHKMKKNLGQERVETGLLSFQGKIGTTALDFPGNDSFSSCVHTFPPLLESVIYKNMKQFEQSEIRIEKSAEIILTLSLQKNLKLYRTKMNLFPTRKYKIRVDSKCFPNKLAFNLVS